MWHFWLKSFLIRTCIQFSTLLSLVTLVCGSCENSKSFVALGDLEAQRALGNLGALIALGALQDLEAIGALIAIVALVAFEHW